MDQNEIFLRILITIVLGAVLGLETETRAIESEGKKQATREEKRKIGGLRTYTVLSLFGGIAGIFYLAGLNIIVYIFFISVMAFTIAAYILNVQLKKAFGLTTEIAIVLTFALGFLTTSAVIPLPVVMLAIVLLTFFLSQKRGIGAAIQKIQHKEVIDVIKFGLISIVILPLLPNQDILLGNITHLIDPTISIAPSLSNIVLINPFQIWLLVVLISGINLLAYVLSKFLGKQKGVFFAGIFGGLVSSTSAVISLGLKSKNEKKVENSKLFSGVALIANSFSFLSIGLLAFITSKQLFIELLPVMLLMFLTGLLVAFYLANKSDKDVNQEHNNLGLKYEAFSIGPAIRFVTLIVIIKLVVQLLLVQNVDKGVLIAITSLSGLTGMDAAVIAFGQLVNNSVITLSTGIIAFMLSNYINFLGKSVYSFLFSERRYFIYLTLGLIVVSIFGALGLLL